MKTIPVYMYHHISPNKGDMITVTPEVFEGQMRFLKDTGYKALSLDELVAFTLGEISIKEKAVAITFDDGYLDNYVYAFPVLKKYNIRAAIFIVADWVEKSSGLGVQGLDLNFEKLPDHHECKRLIKEGKTHEVIMNWDMLKEMQENL